MGSQYFALLAVRVTENGGTKYIQPGGIAFNLTAMLMGILLGGLLACILSVLFHTVVGRFFRALISFRAYSREGSRSLTELGFGKHLMIRHALRSRHSLVRKLVTVVLPDGTVIPPMHSADDDIAAEESRASVIHAEDGPIVHADEGELAEVTKATAAVTESAEATVAEATEAAEAKAAVTESAETTVAEAPAKRRAPIPPEIPFDPNTATYFLDDLHRRRAEIRFTGRGNDARFLIPAVVVFAILATTLPLYMPYFVELLDSLIASILGS